MLIQVIFVGTTQVSRPILICLFGTWVWQHSPLTIRLWVESVWVTVLLLTLPPAPKWLTVCLQLTQTHKSEVLSARTSPASITPLIWLGSTAFPFMTQWSPVSRQLMRTSLMNLGAILLPGISLIFRLQPQWLESALACLLSYRKS